MSEEEIIRNIKHWLNITEYHKKQEYDKIDNYVRGLVDLYNKEKEKVNRLQKENKELKEITTQYNAIGGETFGDDRIIVCSMEYFDNGFFKRNFIHKNRIKDIIEKSYNDIDYFNRDMRKDFEDLIMEK